MCWLFHNLPFVNTKSTLIMKHLFFIILVLCAVHVMPSQVKYEKIASFKLEDERELKIQLPRGYYKNPDKKYPLFVVLDGDYMFEPVAGNVDYFSYWEDMPDAIVVGVNQVGTRDDDCEYSLQSSLPLDKGLEFFEFIESELIPYMDKTYQTSTFRVAVGHGETANFINYYLIKDNPLFQAYIAVSPDFAPNMQKFISDRLYDMQSQIFYCLSKTLKDKGAVQKGVEVLHANMTNVRNDKITYRFDNFEEPSRYTVPVHALPKAFETIFKIYHPISKKEYKEKILGLDEGISPVAYLLEKYRKINTLFGIKKQIIINDFKAISAAIEKTEQYEFYEELGAVARKEYPKTILGSYYMARFHEETGNPKKAMRIYESAFTLKEIGGITKDLMMEKAALIKEDFGY